MAQIISAERLIQKGKCVITKWVYSVYTEGSIPTKIEKTISSSINIFY